MADSPSAANEREETIFRQVRASGLIYALNNGVGCLNWSDEEGLCFPVWSDVHSADTCSLMQDLSYRPRAIEVATFIEEMLPLLQSQGIWIALNPLGEMTGNSHPADYVLRQLRDD